MGGEKMLPLEDEFITCGTFFYRHKPRGKWRKEVNQHCETRLRAENINKRQPAFFKSSLNMKQWLG